MEIKRITPEEAKELLDSNSGYVYLDVRTVPEFDAGPRPRRQEHSRGGTRCVRAHAVESSIC
jgi:rhodanese-related sulfurtransferase